MKKNVLFLLLPLVICTVSFSSAASLYVCQKGSCFYIESLIPTKTWLRKLYPLFKQKDARIDFCEADEKTHTCMAEGLNWYATSPNITAFLSIPVARTLPQKNTLIVDYLVRANESTPECNFSRSTLEAMENQNIRLISHLFSCQIMDFGKTQIQNTFYIDYIDFDNAVLGAKYQIQTHGELASSSAGYALMKFRNGNTLRPLIVEPYYGEEPQIPTDTDLDRQIRHNRIATDDEGTEHPLITELSDWWYELKQSFNLDSPKPAKVREDAHWWTKFTDKVSKILYLEPLD